MTYQQTDTSSFNAPRSREALETALDEGRLWAHMGRGVWWRVRRNGKTQTWKRDPERFRIPLKAGLRSYGEATAEALADDNIFRVEPKDL